MSPTTYTVDAVGTEVDRYWLNAPYAFVSINHDPNANESLYYVVEPELDPFEQDLLEDLFTDIRDRFGREAQSFGRFPSLFLAHCSDDGTWEHYDGGLRVRLAD